MIQRPEANQNTDIDDRDPAREDTGRLMTAGSRKVLGKKGLMILVIAAVLIAAVGITGIVITGDKRYDEQVAIAEKAYIEGDYQSAETGYLAAVEMNKRKPKAREGLAYVYAVEEKFNDSFTVYTELYEDTSEEKYLEAAGEVKEGKLPSDPSLAPGGVVPVIERGPDLSPVYAAYAERLEEEEEGIRAYRWKNGEDEELSKSIVIKDINGDGIPELIYFYAEDEYFSYLNICTYKDGEVIDCGYDPVRTRGETEPSPDAAFFTDNNYGKGVDYIIYTGKETGTFHIACIEGDVTMFYRSTEFSMDEDGYISTVSNVIYDTSPRGESGETLDRYFIDGSETGPEDAEAEFETAADDFKELLMVSISGRHDMAAFRNKSQPQAALDYDEAIEWLQQQG